MKKSAQSKSKSVKSNKSIIDTANEVTSLSKVIAASLFIALPFLGFIAGYYYQNEISSVYAACASSGLTGMLGN